MNALQAIAFSYLLLFVAGCASLSAGCASTRKNASSDLVYRTEVACQGGELMIVHHLENGGTRPVTIPAESLPWGGKSLALTVEAPSKPGDEPLVLQTGRVFPAAHDPVELAPGQTREERVRFRRYFLDFHEGTEDVVLQWVYRRPEPGSFVGFGSGALPHCG